MSEIILLESKFKNPSRIPKNITDTFIDEIIEYGPSILGWSSLLHAQIKYNNRSKTQKQIWYDLLPVYLGLPNWIEFEAQIQEHKLQHLRVPAGFLCDLFECTKQPMGITLSFPNEDGESLRLLHTSTDKLKVAVEAVDSKNQVDLNENVSKTNDRQDCTINPSDNVWDKKQLVIDELRSINHDDFMNADFFVALEFCFSISEGIPGFQEEWYGHIEQTAVQKQKLMDHYKSTDLQGFYELSCAMFEDFEDDYFSIRHFQLVATLAYLNFKERVIPDEDSEDKEFERCSIHYLLEILARSPIYEDEEY